MIKRYWHQDIWGVQGRSFSSLLRFKLPILEVASFVEEILPRSSKILTPMVVFSSSHMTHFGLPLILRRFKLPILAVEAFVEDSALSRIWKFWPLCWLFQCCGVENPSDWAGKLSPPEQYPKSCCAVENDDKCGNEIELAYEEVSISGWMGC